MATFTEQLELVALLFILMALGILLRKRNIIPAEGKAILTDLVIDVTLPASIIMSFLVEITQDRIRQTWQIFVVSLLVQVGCYFASFLLYRRCEPTHIDPMRYGTVVSNSGVLGTPVTSGLFGADGTLLGAVYLIPLRIVMWTLGISIFTRKAGQISVRKVLTHPCILAVIIGIVLMLTQYQPPELITDTLDTVGGCNTALAMILIGSIIGDMDVRLLFHRDTIYFSILRLFALPMLVWLGCTLTGVDALARNIAVILTAMPAGSTTPILALKYGSDASFASAITAVTTVLSLAAVPLWCAFLTVTF